jgi:hypothetical protein
VTTELDLELQRAFDERLAALVPPPLARRRRRARRAPVLAGAALVFSLAIAGFATASAIDAAASTAGASCADALTKVRIWLSNAPLDVAKRTIAIEDVLAMKSACGAQRQLIAPTDLKRPAK